jgi:hypothetical protein
MTTDEPAPVPCTQTELDAAIEALEVEIADVPRDSEQYRALRESLGELYVERDRRG